MKTLVKLMKTQVYISREELCFVVYEHLRCNYGGYAPTLRQVRDGLGTSSIDTMAIQVDYEVPNK